MIIGITGGIGSGKSTVAAELRRLGYRVYDCDAEAKRLIVENEQVRQAMTALFGNDIYEVKDEEAKGDIIYRTDKVAARVFSDRSLLTRLNAIVHPAVIADIRAKLHTGSDPMCSFAVGITSEKDEVYFIESAILYESGVAALCDRVVLVTAPEEVRIERCIQRDYQGVASEENINKVRSRIRAQRPDSDIPADIRLVNDGTRSISELTQEHMLNRLIG